MLLTWRLWVRKSKSCLCNPAFACRHHSLCPRAAPWHHAAQDAIFVHICHPLSCILGNHHSFLASISSSFLFFWSTSSLVCHQNKTTILFRFFLNRKQCCPWQNIARLHEHSCLLFHARTHKHANAAWQKDEGTGRLFLEAEDQLQISRADASGGCSQERGQKLTCTFQQRGPGVIARQPTWPNKAENARGCRLTKPGKMWTVIRLALVRAVFFVCVVDTKDSSRVRGKGGGIELLTIRVALSPPVFLL